MEERFLYHIWDEGHLQYDLKAISGLSIKVIYRGQFNTGRGPDFKNAIIAINGQEFRGDIEIHFKTTDWQAHNHQEDSYYNQVILHVVLEHNVPYAQTIKENGETCEIMSLKNQLSEDIQKLWQEHKEYKTPAVYCDLLSAIDSDRLISILHLAGKRRFEAKCKRFNAALSLSNFDQILYEGIFEALGYSKNKLNTLQIAQSLPIHDIREFKKQGLTKSQLCSIYLCSFGLLQKSPKLLSEELSTDIWNDFEAQRWYAKKQPICWQLFRVRPQNHPIHRIIYISELIWEYADLGLMNTFCSRIELHGDIRKGFDSIWVPRQTLTKMATAKLGQSVVDNIYLNIFLPVLKVWQQKMGQDTRYIDEAYGKLKPLQENHITRFMHRYLNPSQIKLVKSKAIYQQGLMDIYHRYCDWHSCTECTSNHMSPIKS
nr:hypothetical protein [Candidatus Cloacimonadota bacterium]